jgi:hypothetical protein
MCGKAAFSILNAYNPDILFFSGGFVRQLADDGLADHFLAPILEEADKCMEAVYGPPSDRVPIVIGTADNAMLIGACKMASDAFKRSSEHTKADIIEAITDGLTEDELQLLRSLYRYESHVISRETDNDFRKEKLRGLRNRGLISTEPGDSFKVSSRVRITKLGKMVSAELFP